MSEYAVYKGEELLVIGTKKECAEALGVKTDTVEWLAPPANIKRDKGNRKVAVRLN